MKKRFTLLSAMMIASSLTFAQNLPVLPTMKMKPSKISANIASETNAAITPKVGGAVLWTNGFAGSDAAWTIANAGAGAQGAWQIGTYPAQMNQYMGSFPLASGPMAYFNAVSFLLGAPGVPVGVQDVVIESEVIDLTGLPLVTVSWDQAYRRFNSDVTSIEFSTDGGTTWTSSVVNLDAISNGPTLKNTKYIDFVANSATCKFRFRWQSLTANDDYGSGYGWAVDNVKVMEAYANNVALLNLYSVVGAQEITYTKIPMAQAANAGNISFGARVKNTGVATQDIVLEVTSGAYTQSSGTATVVSLAIDSLEIDEPSGFAIPSTLGVSTITGTLVSNNPLDFTGDDVASLAIEVTNKIYAADGYDGTPASMTGSFSGWQGGVGDAEIGTFFEIFADASVGAIHIGIDEVPSNMQSQYIGQIIKGKIYEVVDPNAAPVLIDGTLDFAVAANSFGKVIKAYMIDPILLTAGKTYFVSAAFPEGAKVSIAMSGNTIGGSVAGFNGTSFVSLAADDDDANTVRCPIVRLDFTDYTGVNEIAASYDLNVYPNPFSSNTEVAFELKNDANVSINVTDITGRTVSTVDSQMYTSGAHTVSVNGTNLTAGVYNCTITIGNNVITKRIVKK